MNITAELLDKDIAEVGKKVNALQQQFEQVKAMLAQTSGSLSTLQMMRAFLDKSEEEFEREEMEKLERRKAIKEEEGKLLESAKLSAVRDAVPIEEIAEAVAGPGATVEIDVLKPDPKPSVVNANGSYNRRNRRNG